MIRSLYCSFDTIQKVQSLDASDWRKTILHKLDSVFISSSELIEKISRIKLNDHITLEEVINEAQSLFPLSEEEAIVQDDGAFIDDEYEFIEYLEELLESFDDGIISFVQCATPELCECGAICEDVIEDKAFFNNKGIATLDINSDPEVQRFQDHLYDTTNPDECFSWRSFLAKPLPPSNSAVIIDRYLFITKEKNTQFFYWGAKNVVDILKAIIPPVISDTFPVAILFEYNQLVGNPMWPKYIPIKDCLRRINSFIYNKLKEYNPSAADKVRISYIGIKDPKKLTECNKIDAWKALHNHIHDRLICSNYYWISATGALSASDGTEEESASRWQNVHYLEVLHGAGHPYQKLTALPLFKTMEYLNKLSDCFKAAPSDSYVGYFYNRSKKDFMEIHNNFHFHSSLVDF